MNIQNADRGRARWGHAAVGLLLILAILWLAALSWGGQHSTLDAALLSNLYARQYPALSSAARMVTQLGGWLPLLIATVAATIWLLIRGRHRDAMMLFIAIEAGRAAVELQKWLIARPRPTEVHLVAVQSASFPSGHAANSLMTGLVIALMLGGRRTPVIAALALSLVIGLSRPMLGVHWPSDVIGGWAFGLFWTIAIMQCRETTGRA
ncbi:phosphatase PAP2 family protein [Sphingobium sp. H39-3-25]|uniref:phosphatase PAP2 family protein n=1 Tax=Sphingobium arseniciresistens TaxID=3030834 RepID=UPI0023BA1F1A|nr:phosphatase PAP2 family protein [Sphingobium arseniciresistens]